MANPTVAQLEPLFQELDLQNTSSKNMIFQSWIFSGYLRPAWRWFMISSQRDKAKQESDVS